MSRGRERYGVFVLKITYSAYVLYD